MAEEDISLPQGEIKKKTESGPKTEQSKSPDDPLAESRSDVSRRANKLTGIFRTTQDAAPAGILSNPAAELATEVAALAALDAETERSLADNATTTPEAPVEIDAEEANIAIDEGDTSDETELTKGAILQDALDRLHRPESQRKGAEVRNPFTGEIHKPCFELEIDKAAQAEVAETLGRRSEGLAEIHRLLDKLPPMKQGQLQLPPMPYAESLDPYIEKVEEAYQQWVAAEEKKRAEQTSTVDPFDPFKPPAFATQYGPPSEPPEGTQLQELNTDWKDPHVSPSDGKKMSLEEKLDQLADTTQDFMQWRAALAETMRENQQMVLSGEWLTDQLFRQIQNKSAYSSVRATILQELSHNVVTEDTAIGYLVKTKEEELATKIRKNNVGVPKKGSTEVGLAWTVGLANYRYEEEGESRSGVLADAYITADEVAEMKALGERLDDLFAEPHTTPPSEMNELTEEALARRIVDLSQQLIPEGVSLMHSTPKNRIGKILDADGLKTRVLTGARGGEGAQGDWSNYVHLGEPGKMNIYGSVLLAVPIETVVAYSPYHQAELMYTGAGNTQEKYGAIHVVSADMPLAMQQRVKQLNERFAGGLVNETTTGERNNLAFAASSDEATAALYEYPLDEIKVICSEHSFQSSDLSVYDQDHPGWKEKHVVIADGQASEGFSNADRLTEFVAQDQIAVTDRMTFYGPLSQRQVGFSEQTIGVDTTKLTRNAVDIALRSRYTPEGLIEVFKRRGEYKADFEERADILEGYSVEQHTAMVLGQFDHYFGDKPLPAGMKPDLMRVALTLHDIGTKDAQANGGKHLQHEYTVPKMQKILQELNYTPQERALAVAMVAKDPIGECIKHGGVKEQSVIDLRDQADAAGVPRDAFVDLVTVFYLSDAGSYTSDAPEGKPVLNELFDFDREGRNLRLKPERQRVVDDLKAAVLA